MATAKATLVQLRAELGEQVHLLQYAPLSKVKTENIDDPDAVSFAILFGYIRTHDPANKRKVWVHLYPAVRTGGYPEVQFHSHGGEEQPIKYDAEGIGKQVSGCDTAFKLPRRWSKSKSIALAKYYFLEKLAESQVPGDEEKLRFGVPITKSFHMDLRTVCREFEEEAEMLERSRTLLPLESSSTQVGDGDNDLYSDNSDLSEAPIGLLTKDDEISGGGGTRQAEHSADAERVAEGLRVTQASSTPHDEIVSALVDLNNQGEALEIEAATIQEQIIALDARRKRLQEDVKQVDGHKERLFEGMTAATAFQLGRDVERMQARRGGNCRKFMSTASHCG